MKKLLIASTYYDNPKAPNSNKIWLKLQNHFFEKFCPSYDFAVYLNGVKNKAMFDDYTVIGANDGPIEPGKDAIASHRAALRETISYFKATPGYEAYCILDSDCFPIRRGWYYELNNILIERGKKFAAVVRFENGETFPHPCAILIPKEFIQEDLIRFPADDMTTHMNIIDGSPIRDTGSCNSFYDKEGKFVGHPLVRTNVVNVHPIFAGIYGDTFYHHGLGSRCKNKNDKIIEPVKTYRTKNYWGYHGRGFFNDVSTLFDLISEQPENFIRRLRGVDINQDQRAFFGWTPKMKKPPKMGG